MDNQTEPIVDESGSMKVVARNTETKKFSKPIPVYGATKVDEYFKDITKYFMETYNQLECICSSFQDENEAELFTALDDIEEFELLIFEYTKNKRLLSSKLNSLDDDRMKLEKRINLLIQKYRSSFVGSSFVDNSEQYKIEHLLKEIAPLIYKLCEVYFLQYASTNSKMVSLLKVTPDEMYIRKKYIDNPSKTLYEKLKEIDQRRCENGRECFLSIRDSIYKILYHNLKKYSDRIYETAVNRNKIKNDICERQLDSYMPGSSLIYSLFFRNRQEDIYNNNIKSSIKIDLNFEKKMTEICENIYGISDDEKKLLMEREKSSHI